MGRPAITVKYPLQPLAALMGMTEYSAAKALGMDDSAYCLYKRHGMSELVADRMAVKAGLVPWTVWPEMLERAMNDAKEARLERRRRNQREWITPERAAAYWAKYYAENADYVRAQVRRRYQADPERARAKKRERYHLDDDARQRKLDRQRERYWAIKNAREMKVIPRTENETNSRDVKDATSTSTSTGYKGDVVRHKNGAQSLHKGQIEAEIPAQCHPLSTGYPRNAVSDAAQDAVNEQEVA
jgi:hypothetical protein